MDKAEYRRGRETGTIFLLAGPIAVVIARGEKEDREVVQPGYWQYVIGVGNTEPVNFEQKLS